ncbi:MAG: branched-chain amino acid ABC transporter permease [Deltaproteobacteria bacterium]|nr:branched-chain amino acid ABC transporter permease [Deltaproteobacteria bacterium]
MKGRVIKRGFTSAAVIGSLLLAQRFLPDFLGPYFTTILSYCCFNIILAVGLNVVTGFCGQFSLGHAGFMAVGAYVSALFSVYALPALESSFPLVKSFPQLSFVAALLLGSLSAAGAGWLVGLPALRLRGDYLAIVTLGFGEIIRVLILNLDFAGGARGLIGIPQRTDLFWSLGSSFVAVLFIARMIQSSYGRSLKAIRDDEVAAEAVGVDTTRRKVQAFVIGAFFAGLAGGLFAHHLAFLNPNSFTFVKSVEILIMVVMGGMGSITGSVVTAVFLTILPEALRPLQEITKVDLRMVFYSLLLILTMLLRPAGLFGQKEWIDFIPARLAACLRKSRLVKGWSL